MRHRFQEWPEAHRNLALLLLATLLFAGFAALVFLHPKWKALRETQSEFAAATKKLQESAWPQDSERLTSLLAQYNKELDGKDSGLRHFTQETLKRATSMFEERITDEYGDAANFMEKASQIEYKDQFDRMDFSFQNKRPGIYLVQNIYGLDEATAEPHRYQMLLKLWTTEKLVNLALEHRLNIAVDRNIRTAPPYPHPGAKITALPIKSYLLNEEDKIPYLLEIPVRITVRGRFHQLANFIKALQSDQVFLPPVQMEVLTQAPDSKKNLRENDSVLTGEVLEVCLVCSAFYRLQSEIVKTAPRQTRQLLPPGA